jgi:hypothetical protein
LIVFVPNFRKPIRLTALPLVESLKSPTFSAKIRFVRILEFRDTQLRRRQQVEASNVRHAVA